MLFCGCYVIGPTQNLIPFGVVSEALRPLCFRRVFVDRGLSQSDMNDAQSTHDKIKNNNLSIDCEKCRKLVANAQRVFNAKGE